MRKQACQTVSWMEFTVLGTPQVMPESGEEELMTVKMQWGYGPKGEKPRVFGIDIGTLWYGKLRVLYAFIDPPK